MVERPPATACSQRGGFTLLELLVVVSIVLLLAALLFGVQRAGLARVHSAKCLANLRQIGVAFQQYVVDHQGVLPAMSALENPQSGGGNVLTAQELLGPYTGLPSDFSWNSNTNTTYSFGVWICPADTEPRNKTGPDLARWKGMNSYLVNYYVGRGPVDTNGNNVNARTIERILQTDKQTKLWYFADGIATAGGQGRLSVGMVDAGENQTGALQLRFRHANKVHVLHLAGNVSAYGPSDLVGQGEPLLNPR